jgi:hypothetical protein
MLINWISVNDAMPEFDGPYLCFIEWKQECGNIWRLQEVVSLHMNVWQVLKSRTITHWIPLPEPPNK